jgi:hypothetical protein
MAMGKIDGRLGMLGAESMLCVELERILEQTAPAENAGEAGENRAVIEVSPVDTRLGSAMEDCPEDCWVPWVERELSRLLTSIAESGGLSFWISGLASAFLVMMVRAGGELGGFTLTPSVAAARARCKSGKAGTGGLASSPGAMVRARLRLRLR